MESNSTAGNQNTYSDDKLVRLRQLIASYDSGLVAFSGGLDSTFVLKVAHDMLKDKVVALTIVSPLTPSREVEETKRLKNILGIRHIVKEIDNLTDSNIRSNPRDRCYFCKLLIYREGLRIAKQMGLNVFMDGTTAEDMGSDRPGLKAIHELGIQTPLADAGFTRSEVRFFSRKLDLPTWNKPSQSCLATRIPYGVPLEKSILQRLDQCEITARELGFTQVRARIHSNILRIEVPMEEFELFSDPDVRNELIASCKELDVTYITLDLEGFSSGSMDKF